MPTLAEITESQEALQRAAEEVVKLHAGRVKPVWDGRGIKNDSEFVTILNQCGRRDSADYKKLCAIGE